MNRLQVRRLAAYALIAVATSAATLLAVRARAAGIPDAAALTYTGYLENPDGTPVTGQKSIGIVVYDAETKGKAVCRLDPADVEPLAGRFQLTLPDDCNDAVKANPDLWLEVMVEGSLLGRSKLGAVPYAVEASHAVSADAASGELDARISALEARALPGSSFRAQRNAVQKVPETGNTSENTVLEFPEVDWDEAGEYDVATSTFSPKRAGTYLVECRAYYETASPGTSGWFTVSILVNDHDAAQDGFYGDGWTASRAPSTIISLKKGDHVTCVANHQSSGGVDRVIRPEGNFAAFRIGPGQ